MKGVLLDNSVGYTNEGLNDVTRNCAITSSPGWFGIKRKNDGKTVYFCCFQKGTKFSSLFRQVFEDCRPYSKIPLEARKHDYSEFHEKCYECGVYETQTDLMKHLTSRCDKYHVAMFEVLTEMYPELAEISTSIPGTNQRATLKSLSNVKKDDIVRNYFLPRKKGFSVIDDNQPQSYLVGESVASVM